MIHNRRHRNHERGAVTHNRHRLIRNQKPRLLRLHFAGQIQRDLLRPNRKEIAIRPLHRHRIGQVHQVYRNRPRVTPCRNVKHPGAIHLNRRLLVHRPANGVPHHLQMVRVQNIPERAVDIEWKIRHAPALLPQIQAGNICVRMARKHLRHRQVGITGNQCERRLGEHLARRHLQLVHAVDDARRILQPGKERRMRQRLVLQPDIRIEHRPLRFSGPVHAEQIRQRKILPLCAQLVVETRLVGRNHAAAFCHKLAKLFALRIAQRRDIGQDQRLERLQMHLVHQPVVHHLKGNARLRQRLAPAQRVVFHFLARLPAAVIPRRLLRVHNRHAGNRLPRHQILAVLLRPLIDVFHPRQPALIVQRA